ncbi:D-glycero-beta-D-manno-heptose-7-phosphate kinase [Shumkonia mesophila]|uniref:D-glycero-beta-D-manno-heptose-7-phosphate kinase n=1 Tax=Shumkonia mesophila TaxID=2838854 RepID=UPI00293496DC|nr:D-glycero-beta-D-manno-heptose-7-phosphate kinase [Shumkonia mesophila]
MTDRAQLVPLVEAFGAARVLVVGDIMLDRFVTGAVERISPEAPIPVLRVEAESAMLGGAGNVLRNLAALGASCRFVGAIGDDEAGREVLALLAEHPTVAPELVVEPGRRTSIKTRFVAGTQQMLRADREDTAPLSATAGEAVVTAVNRSLGECDLVVLSDYGKGVLGGGIAARIIAAAHEAGRRVIVDPKGTDYSRYRGAHLLTPNRAELAQATGMPTATDADIVAAARALIAGCGVDAVLATRSRDGMTLVFADDAHHLPTEAREVFDVSGAGDTVIAAVAAALAVGADLAKAARLANVAAGIVVGKVGTAAAYTAEVVAALHRQDLSSAEAKVLSLPQALDRIAVWRRTGRKVGFTNGCFDLLHPGHVALLAKSRAACDRLVVGLNSDASVGRLKGPERPIQPEAARAAVLASLASVDLVVIFSEDTPLALIEAIKPDVLVKGADYTVETVVGADVVQANGGRVLLIELEPGHSTTATIARMNGKAASPS